MIPLRPLRYPKIQPKEIGKSAVEAGKDIGNGFAGYMKKNFNLKEPIFQKSEHRDINNLWTGYEMGGKGRAIATVGLLGVGGAVAYNPKSYQNWSNNRANTRYASEEQDIESLPSTRGDGMGYQAYGGPSLQPSGDLVFALHRLRHGG